MVKFDVKYVFNTKNPEETHVLLVKKKQELTMGWLCVPFHCFNADSWHGLVSDCVQPTTDHRAADPRLQKDLQNLCDARPPIPP